MEAYNLLPEFKHRNLKILSFDFVCGFISACGIVVGDRAVFSQIWYQTQLPQVLVMFPATLKLIPKIYIFLDNYVFIKIYFKKLVHMTCWYNCTYLLIKSVLTLHITNYIRMFNAHFKVKIFKNISKQFINLSSSLSHSFKKS